VSNNGPIPNVDNLPHPEDAPLPEEDRYSGPTGERYVRKKKDVDDLDKGTGTVSDSDFKSVENYIPPRGVPR
jgi:hypothetical protein